MPHLYIAEFHTLGQMPPQAEQKIAIEGVSKSSKPFGPNTNFIRLNTDAPCSIAVGADPEATLDNARLSANQTEPFGVSAGHRLAVIANI